jgi:UDP-glucose 4-epimerase
MRVFLTGVSGILGGVIADRLARLPDVECITGIDVTEPKKSLPTKVQFTKVDVRAPEVTKIMVGHDTVVHTAIVMLWQAQMPSDVRRDINVNGAASIARAAAANHVGRFIHMSSTAAYDMPLLGHQTAVAEDFPLGRGNSNSYYCNDKAAAERAATEILDTTQTRLIILRPCGIGGPSFGRTARLLRDTASRRRGPEPLGQIVDEEDVAAACVQAVQSDIVGAFNVVPDGFIRMKEVWKITGARMTWMPTVCAILIAKMAWRYLGSPIHPSWVTASTTYFAMSNDKLKAAGWRPQYSSVEALRRASL